MKSRWLLLAALLLIVVPALGFAAWTWITLNFSYSNGERAGYLQKISRKGWICKTWEGEIVMPTQPGAVPQIFSFTVPNDAVAQQLVKAAGQRVSLSYEQHQGVPTTCFGESEYFVTAVAVTGEPGNPAAVPPQPVPQIPSPTSPAPPTSPTR